MARKRRKKWQPPNNPTRQAQRIWKLAYPGEPWPRGWKVRWAGWMRGVMGLCRWYDKEILLNHGDAAKRDGKVIVTLIHEFVHVRFPNLRHGKEFDRLVRQACERIGLVS